MTLTITGTTNTSVTLGSASDNPTTIVATSLLNDDLHMAYNGLTLVNAGRIAAGSTSVGFYGVGIRDSGTLINEASGTITGPKAIYAYDGDVTIVNAGH